MKLCTSKKLSDAARFKEREKRLTRLVTIPRCLLLIIVVIGSQRSGGVGGTGIPLNGPHQRTLMRGPPLVGGVHDRMPMMLLPDEYDT